ncbi:MAG: hypothetical protein QOF02_674 [Blastocatellia bacterium]|nr:hypothetical protein [Blastocatellia bacterium]
MKLFSRLTRRFVFAATLTLMLLGAFLPSSSSGHNRVVSVTTTSIGYEKEITYYSDPGLTNYVGTGHIYCNGRGTLTGTSSPYHTEEILNTCCGSVPC